VWIDDGEIGPFDAIPDAVRDGLSQAKVLLAWYSHAYPTRRACREELTLALLAAENNHEGHRRVLVVDPEPTLDHVLEAQLLDRRFATAEDLQDPSALARRIVDRVGAVADRFGALSVPGRVRWYGGAGWESGSRRFVGRLGELWKLHDLLHRTMGLAGPGQAGRAVALVSGFGGVGKSLLAAEYAHTFASCYPGGIVWLSALGHDARGGALTAEQSQAAADTQLTQLARSLSLDATGLDPATIRERVKSELDRRGQPVLWIADDLPTGLDADGLDAWRCPAAMVHELLTTRDRSHSRFQRLDLDVLQPADALALLSQGRRLDAEEWVEAKALADELGYHPLACDVAGLYIAGSTTFADYRRLLAGNLGRFDDLASQLSDQLPGDHAHQIAATLATSLQQLGPDAWQLLRLAALLAPAPIPRAFVVAMFQRLGRDGDTAEWSVNNGMQDRHQDGSWRYDSDNASVTVHVLVATAAAALDPHPELGEPSRQAVLATLAEMFRMNAADIRQHEALGDVAPHARHLVAKRDAQLDQTAASLLDDIARYDLEAGRAAASAEQYERLLLWEEQVLGPEHSDTLASRNNLAAAYRAAGRLAEALPLFQRTLADRERLLGPEHPDTLASRGNLATAYQAAGRVAEALALSERSLADAERLLGPDHPNTLTSRGNLALAYRAAGRVAEALALSGRTLADRERLLGPEHPDTLASRNNLALAYQAAGRLAEALPLFQRTLADAERLLGPDHPNTLTSRNNLAAAYRAAGRLAEALALSGRTLADFERLLGPDHPNTLTSRNNLARAYQDAGRLAEALALSERTLADFERLLGPEHPDTLASRNNLAAAYRAAGRLAEALPLFQRTLADRERLLGPEHPDTLTSRSNLAHAYLAAGRLPEYMWTLDPDHREPLGMRRSLAKAPPSGTARRRRKRSRRRS
jgi:Tetratricopeptide repeat